MVGLFSSRIERSLLAVLAAVLLLAALTPIALAQSGGATAAAKSKPKCKTKSKSKSKCKPKPKPAGPSISVAGFSLNRTFVARGTKLTNPGTCDEITGSGSPQSPGPPQNVYFAVYMRATAIPASTPTQESYSIPEAWGGFAGLNEQPTLTPAAPWSRVFGAGGGPFGGPPGSKTGVYHGGEISFNDEDGPSPSGFDGVYTWTISVLVGTHTLTSTATATVAC